MLRSLLFLLFSIVSFSANAETAVVIKDAARNLDLLKAGAMLYRDNLSTTPLTGGRVPSPPAPISAENFVAGLEQVPQVDQITGGRYWLYAKVENVTDVNEWVFNSYNSVIDRIHIYLYTTKGIREVSSGYLYPHEQSLHYGIELNLPRSEQYEILVLIESRYFSGLPQFEFITKIDYQQDTLFENLLFIGCFGAIIILAFYNLFLAVSLRDKSYLYYALYLLLSVFAWAAAFNALAEWLSWYSHYLLIPPFFLTIAFNTLYYIHFLELPQNSPKLSRFSYGLVIGCFAMVLVFPLFSPGIYMTLFGLSSFVWIVSGLSCGLIRLHNGYKPARFFVAAFVVLFVGMLLSILYLFGVQPMVKNSYLVTLVAQTIDMLLLSLALADRINIYREERESALKKYFEVERRAMKIEQEANIKLHQALTISVGDSQKKSEFLRMVSHELRTPLHSIVSSVEQWNDSGNEWDKLDLVSFVSHGANRLRSQIDNLVLLAETDDSQLDPIVSDFEIRPLLFKLSSNVAGLIQQDVEFIFQTIVEYPSTNSAELPVTFQGDVYLVEHLLRSVLENACKYTSQGKVEFNVSWDEIKHKLIADITDTGHGMTQEQQKTIFNEFVQVSHGLDRQSEGLGLGLTICYRLCKILAADFEIDSILGEGTHVRISLPLESSSQEFTSSESEVHLKNLVLIVEDNLVNAQVLQHIVAQLGYNVDVVFSGQEALRNLEHLDYDLILMDIQMPVMDGITATRWIRQRGIETPIVAVTANSDFAVRRQCIDVGMNEVMVKPVRQADIGLVLDRVLQINR
jgi:signal transduction histidine kinase